MQIVFTAGQFHLLVRTRHWAWKPSINGRAITTSSMRGTMRTLDLVGDYTQRTLRATSRQLIGVGRKAVA